MVENENSSEWEWVIKVQENVNQIDNPKELVEFRNNSIYRIPDRIRDNNKTAYTPQFVSFGPYHHGEEHLKFMEDHKKRALVHFLKRSNKPLNLFVQSLSTLVEDFKKCYDSLDYFRAWKDDEFLKLMISDGCFMLEIMRSAIQMYNDYAINDPIFSNHGKLNMIPYIRRDMLMLENQLPFSLLCNLVAIENDKFKEDVENKLIRLVLEFYNLTTTYNIIERRVRSAIELKEAGIQFKQKKYGSLIDITFNRGTLKLPLIIIDDHTESMFLNLIAFERFHVGAGNEVTSYIFFMNSIINNEKDVSLLHSRGIIQNAIGSDKAVAKLFNSLSKGVTLDPNSSLDQVQKEVDWYCENSWNGWIHTYFRSPWAMLSVNITAILLFALSAVQTIYTVYPYYHPRQNSSYLPPPSPPS